MKMIIAFIAVLVLFVSKPSFCQNIEVHEVPFKIAGGKIIKLKITDQGALPAENEKIKITTAAVLVGPSGKDKMSPALIWSYGLAVKTTDDISKITIEDVFPNNPAVLILTDNMPKIENGNWIGQVHNGDANGSNNAWLKTKKLSVFVFKFTVYFKDGSNSVLYQLSAFNEEDKKFFLERANMLQKLSVQR